MAKYPEYADGGMVVPSQPKHAKPRPSIRRRTHVETDASQFADKDVALTIWQGVQGFTTEHTWPELLQLHAQLGALLHEAEQLVPEYEYAVQLRDTSSSGLPWINWTFQESLWVTKGTIERYLATWVGTRQWEHLQYRVYRRPKAGAVETVAEGTGHDTAPATF